MAYLSIEGACLGLGFDQEYGLLFEVIEGGLV